MDQGDLEKDQKIAQVDAEGKLESKTNTGIHSLWVFGVFVLIRTERTSETGESQGTW